MTTNITIGLQSNLPPAVTSAAQLHVPRLTSFDLVERLVDFAGGDPGENVYRQARRALFDALREFSTAHRWTYLMAVTRMQLNGSMTLGTVQYQYSSGTYPRQLTLTPDPVALLNWPTWAANGYVRINNIVAKVSQRVSNTVLTLQDPYDYAADVAAGSGFTLFQDGYTLPLDFSSGDNTLAETIWGRMEYVRPMEWLAWIRWRESYGVPRWFTVMGDPNVPGALCVRIYPFPDTNATLDMLYQRRPRAVSTIDLSTGHASVNASVNAQLVTLDQSVLTSAHVGSVVRLASQAGNPPTGPDGLYPYAFEGNVVSVLSATQCTVDTACPTLSGVAYRVSDPIDVEDQAMATAFARMAELHMARSRMVERHVLAGVQKAADDALVLAKEADARIQSRRAVGIGGNYRPRMAFMPRGPDIS